MKEKNASGTVNELTSILEECEVIEVTTAKWAPYYARGDMLFAHSGSTLAKRDRVSLTTQSGRHVLGIYVEKDKKQTVIQSCEGTFKIERFDESDLKSVTKIIAVIYQ